MAFHDAICKCFEGTMLEPCLLKPCFHVAGLREQRLEERPEHGQVHAALCHIHDMLYSIVLCYSIV